MTTEPKKRSNGLSALVNPITMFLLGALVSLGLAFFRGTITHAELDRVAPWLKDKQAIELRITNNEMSVNRLREVAQANVAAITALTAEQRITNERLLGLIEEMRRRNP